MQTPDAPSRYTFGADTVDTLSSHGIMLDLVGRNRDVLDVGCAAGDLARALRARDCRVCGIEYDPVAAEAARPDLDQLVIGDLETADWVAPLQGRTFDTIVFGDVLEHLRDPLSVLRRSLVLLRPGGSVVMSIPNVAHASVRLSLLRGDFTYRDIGLLDATHLHFFTRASVRQLVRDAGLVVVDERRTVLGPFDSEIPVREQDFPRAVVDFVMSDPDAVTYQFVLEAVLDDAEGRVSSRAMKHARLQDELATSQRRLLEAQASAAAAADAHRSAQAERDHAIAEAEAQSARAREAESRLASVYASTAWRVSAPVRALGPLRTALQGPAQTRRSLRRPGALRAAARSLHRQGTRATLARVRQELAADPGQESYHRWLERYGDITPADAVAIRRHIQLRLLDGPVISVVMPVYDTAPDLLRAAVLSVREQLYDRWELCVVDDASPSAGTQAALAELAAADRRITVHRRADNGGIAAATNDALRLAGGDLVAFMDHDDVLPAHALYLFAALWSEHPDTDVAYSDEDKLDERGQRYDPHFKPDFDAELLLGQNFVSHLTVMRRAFVEQLGGLDENADGSQDHDLLLRATEASTPERIRHLPWILYHWRQYAGSDTFSGRRLDTATAASRVAVAGHLTRRGESGALVQPADRRPGWHRILRQPPTPLPAVTAVIPTRDRLSLLRPCIEGLLDRTDYPALRVLIVDNDSSDPATVAYLKDIGQDPRIDVLAAPGPFNYAALNNLAVEQVDTPLVLMLNNDIVVREDDWLREMVSLLCLPGTGAVGAKLLYGDGRVQHAGVILGIGGVAGHSHKHFPGTSSGYFGRLILNQTVSAVTGACLLTRTELYRELGGLDEDNLAIAFNDIDFCLRLGEAGHRITFAANAVLDHLESASRGPEISPTQVARFNREADYMRERWGERLLTDPAYNPNLTHLREDFSLADPPRVTPPWQPFLS